MASGPIRARVSRENNPIPSEARHDHDSIVKRYLNDLATAWRIADKRAASAEELRRFRTFLAIHAGVIGGAGTALLFLIDTSYWKTLLIAVPAIALACCIYVAVCVELLIGKAEARRKWEHEQETRKRLCAEIKRLAGPDPRFHAWSGLSLKAIVAYARRSIVPPTARFCAVYVIYLALVLPFAREPGAAVILGIPLSIVGAHLWKRSARK